MAKPTENETDKPESNKAGDTKTTSKEYVKRESGKQDMPHVPAEKTGHTSPNADDLEHPEQQVDNPAAPDEASKKKPAK